VYTAVIEFDSLANTVWAAANDHDFVFIGVANFVFVAIGGVIVGGIGFEFRGAGVHQFVGGNYAVLLAQFAHLGCCLAEKMR